MSDISYCKSLFLSCLQIIFLNVENFTKKKKAQLFFLRSFKKNVFRLNWKKEKKPQLLLSKTNLAAPLFFSKSIKNQLCVWSVCRVDHLPSPRICSHYPHLEDLSSYGRLLSLGVLLSSSKGLSASPSPMPAAMGCAW